MHRTTDPRAKDILLKEKHHVSLPVRYLHYRAAMIWYNGKREGDNVNPNEHLNISQDLVTKLTRHEPPDLFDSALLKRLHTVGNQSTQWEFKSLEHVSREAGFSNTVEVGQCFVA